MKATPAPCLKRAVAAATLAFAALTLSGCSDRDALLSEKVAAADAAALRAVQAAERAEAAVRQVNPAAALPAPTADAAAADSEDEDPNATEERAAEEASAPTDSGDPPKT